MTMCWMQKIAERFEAKSEPLEHVFSNVTEIEGIRRCLLHIVLLLALSGCFTVVFCMDAADWERRVAQAEEAGGKDQCGQVDGEA